MTKEISSISGYSINEQGFMAELVSLLKYDDDDSYLSHIKLFSKWASSHS